MLKQIIDLGKQYVGLARKTERHETDIVKVREDLKALGQEVKELRQELQTLTQTVQQTQWEQKHAACLFF